MNDYFEIEGYRDVFFQTPCYIFNQEDFEKNIQMFQECLWECFRDNYIIGYSFKTNSVPYIVNCARKVGCYAEVVSEKEYILARNIGYPIDKIIYNGPIKTKESFLESVKNGAIVNIDSHREIEWLSELPKGQVYAVGIRVNFDLEVVLPGQTLMGDEGGRFGFCDENGELSYAIHEINEMENIRINGLHMHVSSKSKSSEIYDVLVERACEISKRENLTLRYIDVGGSFFGGGDDGSSYKKYVQVIYDCLKKNDMDKVTVIVEPGASVIASTVDYLIEITDIKRTTKNIFVNTNGTRLHVDPFFSKNKYNYEILSENKKTIDNQVICGFTCMEKDRFMKLENARELAAGDRIVLHMQGSYTMCFNSDFIHYPPLVYVRNEGKAKMIRCEKEVSQFLQNNQLEV